MQGLCLVPTISQFITLLAQFIVLMTHGYVTTIPDYSLEDAPLIYLSWFGHYQYTEIGIIILNYVQVTQKY
jgi:hypothetical protein